jgi:hypothetical protein
MRSLVGRWLCLGVAVVASSPLSSTARAGEITHHLRTTLKGGGERRALARALAGAIRRLNQPGCRRIFTDFQDSSGSTLQERLDAAGQDGASFLRDWVFFADGEAETRCDDPRVLAFTEPGSRSVWICGRRFSQEQWSDPAYAEAVLIHELLHVLGLGEGPPASGEISRRVVARCGR